MSSEGIPVIDTPQFLLVTTQLKSLKEGVKLVELTNVGAVDVNLVEWMI